VTATDRLRAVAEIAWAGRPRWWDYLYATAAVVLFLAVLHAPAWAALAAGAIVLLGGPWLDIWWAWIRHGRRSTCSCGDQKTGTTP
jgi:hypothetical protein